MSDGYRHINASTIGDVLHILYNLEREGYDMTSEWNGWDDGSICIHSKDKDWVAIDPYNENGIRY